MIRSSELPEFLLGIAKVLGGVVRDTIDTGDYKVTIFIERKVDDDMGILIDHISIEKRMNVIEVETMRRRLKDLVNKL